MLDLGNLKLQGNQYIVLKNKNLWVVAKICWLSTFLSKSVLRHPERLLNHFNSFLMVGCP